MNIASKRVPETTQCTRVTVKGSKGMDASAAGTYRCVLTRGHLSPCIYDERVGEPETRS